MYVTFTPNMFKMARAFFIPPDFDDTSCHLGLGSLLFSARDQLPRSFQLWKESNRNITFLASLISKYAYRPFSSGINANSIDPR